IFSASRTGPSPRYTDRLAKRTFARTFTHCPAFSFGAYALLHTYPRKEVSSAQHVIAIRPGRNTLDGNALGFITFAVNSTTFPLYLSACSIISTSQIP